MVELRTADNATVSQLQVFLPYEVCPHHKGIMSCRQDLHIMIPGCNERLRLFPCSRNHDAPISLMWSGNKFIPKKNKTCGEYKQPSAKPGKWNIFKMLSLYAWHTFSKLSQDAISSDPWPHFHVSYWLNTRYGGQDLPENSISTGSWPHYHTCQVWNVKNCWCYGGETEFLPKFLLHIIFMRIAIHYIYLL